MPAFVNFFFYHFYYFLSFLISRLLFYILYANKRDTKRQKAKLKPYTEDIKKYSNFGPEKLLEIKNSDPIGYLHSNYIYNKNFTNSVTSFKIFLSLFVPISKVIIGFIPAENFILVPYS